MRLPGGAPQPPPVPGRPRFQGRPPGRRRGRLAGVVLAAVLTLVTGCGEEAPPELPTGPVTAAGVELVAVPHPALDGVEAAARGQLQGQRRAVAALLAGEGQDRKTLALAFGRLGSLYHAYGLAAAAVPCYRNAGLLAPEEPRWPYLRGVLLRSEGRLPEAAAALERALELAPADGPTLLHLGEVELAAGRPAAARERFTMALAVGEPYAPAARYGLGRAAAALGEPARAVELFQAVLAARPGAGAVRYPLALALRRLGRTEEARTYMERRAPGAVSFPDPLLDEVESLASGAGVHARRGGEALMSGRPEEAVAEYRQALGTDPAFPEARRNLALSLVRLGRYTEAREELDRALAADPDNVWLHFDLGNVRLTLGDPEGAVASFRRAAELAPGFTEARFNLANTLIGLERWDEAVGPLEEVVAADPRNVNARYLLAMSYEQRGDRAEAVRRLEALVAEAPGHGPALAGLASIRALAGDPGEARELYLEALAATPEVAEKARLHLRLAELEVARRSWARAAGHYRTAAELDPTNAAARIGLGDLLVRERDFDQAAEVYAQAVELAPGDPAARAGEAGALAAAGRYPEARQRLEAAVAALPDNVLLAHALARLLASCPDAGVRDGRRALTLSQAVYRARPSVPHAETVAMALAETGDFAGAAGWLRSLITRVEQEGRRGLARRLRADLARYERGEPVRRAVP